MKNTVTNARSVCIAIVIVNEIRETGRWEEKQNVHTRYNLLCYPQSYFLHTPVPALSLASNYLLFEVSAAVVVSRVALSVALVQTPRLLSLARLSAACSYLQSVWPQSRSLISSFTVQTPSVPFVVSLSVSHFCPEEAVVVRKAFSYSRWTLHSNSAATINGTLTQRLPLRP